MNAAVRVGRDVRCNRTPPRQRPLGCPRRPEHDEVDVIGAREVEERAAGVGAFDDVQRNPRRGKAEGLDPMAKAHLVLEMPTGPGIQRVGAFAQRRRFHDRDAHQA